MDKGLTKIEQLKRQLNSLKSQKEFVNQEISKIYDYQSMCSDDIKNLENKLSKLKNTKYLVENEKKFLNEKKISGIVLYLIVQIIIIVVNHITTMIITFLCTLFGTDFPFNSSTELITGLSVFGGIVFAGGVVEYYFIYKKELSKYN